MNVAVFFVNNKAEFNEYLLNGFTKILRGILNYKVYYGQTTQKNKKKIIS